MSAGYTMVTNIFRKKYVFIAKGAVSMAEKKSRAPRKKAEPKPRINTKEWRDLPYDKWTTASVLAYFTEMNTELYGMEYAPMRNYGFEQGAIKQALTKHGAELLRQAFDECFRDYRPNREYPILTAGFALSYRVNGIIPRLKAEQAEKDRLTAERERISEVTIDHKELEKWW
jgi:hypothetical protein